MNPLDILHVIVLAIIQGITEFLPVSSSAHLILVPYLFGWEDQGLTFDVALHVGTLVAVLIYFRKELRPLLTHWFTSCKTRQLDTESRLVWGIGLATIPAIIVGLSAHFLELDNELRSPLLIAGSTILFALLMGWADTVGKRERDEYSLSLRDILLIGLAQAIAIIPGTSRSGITITMGLFLGLERRAAARFSFLLSIPTITLAALDALLVMPGKSIEWTALAIGMLVSAISAYLCIHFFISLLGRITLLPFIIYRIALGIFLIFWFA